MIPFLISAVFVPYPASLGLLVAPVAVAIGVYLLLSGLFPDKK